MVLKSIPEFGHSLRTKDISYRAMKDRRRETDRTGRVGGGDERRRDRSGRFESGKSGRAEYDRKEEKKGAERGSRRSGNEGRNGGRQTSNDKKDELPQQLPREKWRKDDKGRMMKRKCRFCDKWHMDFDCPTRPASYSISTAFGDQWHSSADEEAESSDSDPTASASSTSSDSESAKRDTPRWKSTKGTTATYHNVYSTAAPDTTADIKLPRANYYRIEELPAAFLVGTGVSYLSAQPCPVKAWVGSQPSPSRPLRTGVIDSGGPSIIAKDLIPDTYTILNSPLKPVFAGIGESRTASGGYVVLPVHLPNSAAMSGDERSARIAKLWIEFQVVESCPAGFLLGVDAISAYKMIIDYLKATIHLNAMQPPMKIPIADGTKYTAQRVDPRIYAAEPVNIRPFSEVWVPVRFAPFGKSIDHLLVTPVRHANIAEGTYASCSYAVMANDTSHLLMINPSPRPVRISRDQLVGMYEPFHPNTPYSYYGSTSLAVGTAPPNLAPTTGIFNPLGPVDTGSFNLARTPHIETHATPSHDRESPLDQAYKTILPTLGLDDPELTWHDGLDAPVDPFGLENEFREKGPLQEKEKESGEEKGEDASATSESRAERRARSRAEEKRLQRQRRATKDRPGGGNDNTNNPTVYSASGTSDDGTNDSEIKWDICPDLSRKDRRMWKKMLESHRKAFAGPEGRLGKVHSRFNIHIEADTKNIKSQQPYRTSPRKRKLIREAVEKLKELDVIQPSSSDIASPVVVVVQKGKPRFCIDLQEVNSKTIADRYALPKQDSVFRALVGSIYFSIIDANKGYFQFGLTVGSQRYTAFVTEDGFYEFKRVPFGLKNAPAHFQQSIDTILGSYRYEFALAFIDDIVIYSKSLADHLRHVSLVLQALENVGMTVSESKCHFAYHSIELLGRRVSRLGLSTQPEKVEAIMKLPYPRTIGEAAEIYGQFNYHRDFIKDFSEIALPITKAMSPTGGRSARKDPKKPAMKLSPKDYARIRSNTAYPDRPEIRNAFQLLKEALSNAPVLAHPDFEKEFILYSDACRKGVPALFIRSAKMGGSILSYSFQGALRMPKLATLRPS